ncbi:MAG TPA: hypothetical protein PLJ26_04000 [Candidatus Omnitrophota bacterium]|nr:hypothetical protein [Candidatus Omnitrophota bacterium]HQJ15626.1 hypothetical protein [Candidatus Omnitrophota bacterium]
MTDMIAAARRRMVACIVVACMTACLCSCDAFARKFTRKPKKEARPAEPMVLEPAVYADRAADTHDAYRRYFMYWEGWHAELIAALADEAPSMRRKLDCVREAIRNLNEMQGLLSGNARAEADKYLLSMNGLKNDIEKDLYGTDSWAVRKKAEDLKRLISRTLQYALVKGDLR